MKIDDFKLTPGKANEVHSGSLPSPGTREHFLKGPIPMGWLAAAAKLPGSVMEVAIYLWYLAGMRRTGEVTVPASKIGQFSCASRFTVYRALGELEKADLIAVKRHRGRHAVVILKPCPAHCETGAGRD